jgi:ribonuclease E
MNQKREYIASIEKNYGLSVRVEGDLNLVSPEYSIEKLKSATRILTENEPVLVTADGLMDKSEEDETEDFQSDDERPKKRRRRRRKKRQFTNEEEVKSDQDETGKQGNSETGVENIPSSNENTPAENIKEDFKRRRRNKQSNEKQEVITVSIIESTEEKAVGGETEVKSTDKLPKEEKEKKKRAPRKPKKVDLENSDEPKLNDEEEKAKQKRRGWWSLKG